MIPNRLLINRQNFKYSIINSGHQRIDYPLCSNVANEVHNALDELNADESQYIPSHPSGGGREAEELFLLPDCVHIFFVTGSGKVSTFSEPSTLRIFRFKDDSTNQNKSDATTFIQVKN